MLFQGSVRAAPCLINVLVPTIILSPLLFDPGGRWHIFPGLGGSPRAHPSTDHGWEQLSDCPASSALHDPPHGAGGSVAADIKGSNICVCMYGLLSFWGSVTKSNEEQWGISLPEVFFSLCRFILLFFFLIYKVCYI